MPTSEALLSVLPRPLLAQLAAALGVQVKSSASRSELARLLSWSAAPSASLAATFPAIAAQWHPSKNGTVTPGDVEPSSTRLVYWQCSNDPNHVSVMAVRDRLARPGCSRCGTGHRAGPTSSLSARYPEVAACWHPTKNDALTPDDVTPGSARLVWWRCPSDPAHAFRASILNVVRSRVSASRGCAACARSTRSTSRSLALLRPELAAEWHPTRNRDLCATRVGALSDVTVWWQCTRDPSHAWRATVRSRARGGRCLICYPNHPRKPLRETHPHLAEEWHPTKNDPLTPDDVGSGVQRKVVWRCSRVPAHEWTTGIITRVKGRGCPVCAGSVVTSQNCLASRYPLIAAEWHRSKNGGLTPRDVHGASARFAWWQCSRNAKHAWSAKIAARTASNNRCPHCRIAKRQARGAKRALDERRDATTV
ncbi:MAG: zinc-ribbon domain-containing protein [Polyangiaceae bacterium]|nr:zinc-ribbon domain-containing protein [Polyangiaceae bacterium]